MGDKLTYSDVCHIIMPIIGYYGLYSDKDMVELKKDLGLGLLEFKLNKEFNGKYVYGAKGRRDSDLERAITDYIRDEKIIVYYDEENKKGATKLMLNQNECREEIKKLYSIYGEKEVKFIRRHFKHKALHKVKEPDNPKYLAEYL